MSDRDETLNLADRMVKQTRYVGTDTAELLMRGAEALRSSAEPVAFVPLSKAERTKGEPLWHETRPSGATDAWKGYELMSLYAAPPVPASVREALERQCDNMAFILNHCDVKGWYDKFTKELAEDRARLSAPPEHPTPGTVHATGGDGTFDESDDISPEPTPIMLIPPHPRNNVYFMCQCCEEESPESAVCCREDIAVMPDGTWLCDSCYSDCEKTAYGMVANPVNDFEFPCFEDLPRPAPYIASVTAPQAAPEPTREEIEQVAKIVYDAMPFDAAGEKTKPAWVPCGNSIRQSEARTAARAILALTKPRSEHRVELDANWQAQTGFPPPATGGAMDPSE